MVRICSAVLLLLVWSVGAVAAESPASPDPKSLVISDGEQSKARQLVQQLGSEQFAERELAEEVLAKMGRLARAALLEGANTDASPEVRGRCQTLLPKATALEMQARLAVFLADAEGKFEHDLPGWNEFRGVVRGDWTLLGHTLRANHSLDRAARKVFADLLSTSVNRNLLLAVGGQQSNLSSIASNRRQELYYQKYPRTVVVGGVVQRPGVRREPTLADVVTLLFAECQAGPKYIPPRVGAITILITSSRIPELVQGADDEAKVYRALATAWLDSRTDPMDMYYAMTLASAFNLPDNGARMAVKLFESKTAIATYRGMAAARLAQVGNKSHIPLLESAMTDSSVMTTARRVVFKNGRNEIVSTEIQIRDVALAVAVLLAGEKPDEYGFEDLYPSNGPSYTYTRYHFPSYGWFWSADDARKKAMDKWGAVRGQGR